MQSRKFDRQLPREQAFIFKDPKRAGEFYAYINKKYRLNHKDVGFNIPVAIGKHKLFLRYYEVEKTDQKFNLPLALIDAKRTSNGNDAIFEDNYTTRQGHWYILVTIYDAELNNCLKKNHELRPEVVTYLKALKDEYLATQNYEELLLK